MGCSNRIEVYISTAVYFSVILIASGRFIENYAFPSNVLSGVSDEFVCVWPFCVKDLQSSSYICCEECLTLKPPGRNELKI